MPITRRRRATPPGQPDQPEQNNHLAESSEQVAESLIGKEGVSPLAGYEHPSPGAPAASGDQASQTPPVSSPALPAMPPQANGDRPDRQEPLARHAPEGGPVRRVARGEVFRRPPQPPVQPPPSYAPPPPPPVPQAPTHEISLPLGNMLHLAYNPGYTGSDEARGLLLNRLTEESKAGGRARCWNCGSLAVAYDRWNTRSKTFGEIGIAACEICGVWSVM